jgi:iron complex outermembrane receptor protein
LNNALQTTLYVGPTATGEYTDKGLDFRASGEMFQMAAGPMGVAFGATVHKEDFSVEVPDILGLGDIAGLGGATSPADGSRKRYGAYAEVSIPITKTFETNLSARVDHYDDLKSDKTPVTGKAAFAWKPLAPILVRGNVGRGFRAPTLGELHTPVTVGTSEQFVDPLFQDIGPVQVNALTGGNPDLKPEKSKQWSLGVVFSHGQTISAHVDYWQITIDDFIVSPAALPQIFAARGGSQLVRPGEVIFADDGEVDTVNEVLANAATAKFSGFDFGAHWGDGFGFGRLTADYNGTYFTKADLLWPNGVLEHSIATLVDPNGNTLTLPGNGVILRYKHNLSLGWSNSVFGASITQNYYTGYRTANNQIDNEPHRVSDFTTYDVQGYWVATKNIKLTAGVKNVFDKDPHLVIPTANFFQAGYDPSIYDPRARFWYGRVTVTF